MSAQPDLFAAAADAAAERRDLDDERARATDNRRDADILARMLEAHLRSTDVLCGPCRALYETRLAEEDPIR